MSAIKQSGSRLHGVYRETIVPKLLEDFEFGNVMAVPALSKITINMGLGEAVTDRKVIDQAMQELALISGQKPVVTRARKSEAGFKIRAGWPVGCKVTLRRNRMYEFLDRLVNVALPRIRDFRGISPKSFDGRGNYSLGIREQIVFPEIDYDQVDAVRGMDVVITTTARNNAEARGLLDGFGLPFRAN